MKGYTKYKCSICKKQEIRERSSILHCENCNNIICDDCLKEITVHNDNFDIFEQLSQYNKSYHKCGNVSIIYLCQHCLENIEKDYIENIPLKNIPLMINFPWETQLAILTLHNRMSQVTNQNLVATT